MEIKWHKHSFEIPQFIQEYFEERDRIEAALRARLCFVLSFRLGTMSHAQKLLLRLTTRAGIVLTDQQQKRIETCADLPLLDQWTENAVNAKSADEVFGE